jgi:hypothetical protein
MILSLSVFLTCHMIMTSPIASLRALILLLRGRLRRMVCWVRRRLSLLFTARLLLLQNAELVVWGGNRGQLFRNWIVVFRMLGEDMD